jgi:hypothetical protein
MVQNHRKYRGWCGRSGLLAGLLNQAREHSTASQRTQPGFWLLDKR